MNTKFIVNDYVLIWNLLFQAAISETIYNLKQKLWDTYKDQYNAMFKDKSNILKDYKNFIPNDDTIYNILLTEKDYEKLRKRVDKYRLEVMKLWDKNKKVTDNLVSNILRLNIPNYNFFIVNKELNIIDHPTNDSLIIGKEIDSKDPLKLLLDINMSIASNNIKSYKEQYVKFKKTILELAIYNEYATRLTKRSCYQSGSPALSSLKRWLYPYWLMYLGVPQDEFPTYMMRDKIVFDTKKYAYEKELKKISIEEFIDFCIRNQRYIIREPKEIKQEIEII